MPDRVVAGAAQQHHGHLSTARVDRVAAVARAVSVAHVTDRAGPPARRHRTAKWARDAIKWSRDVSCDGHHV